MVCGICGQEVESKFYRHINSHRLKVCDYLEQFPNQVDEFKKQKGDVWNKGKTAESDFFVAKNAAGVRKYANQTHIKERRSELMKARYETGDILSPEIRRKVTLAGSKGWVSKIKSATLDERKEFLHAFTKAGNTAQAEKRISLTPSDFQRLYPWAKGKARYCNCDFCGKQMIGWFGGKPRPKKRFCGNGCWDKYKQLHPMYVFSKSARRYYSGVSGQEFILRSSLEEWIATCLDLSGHSWCVPAFYINYEFLGKNRKYYPDFLVDNRFVLEVKSGYVANVMQGQDQVEAKIRAAIEFCKNNNYEFMYWQFNDANLSFDKVITDARVKRYILG